MCFMAVRLLEMRRVLRPTGSIYLHCDHTASHYLKAVLDAIFGRKNFRNEIVWCYNVGGKGKNGGHASTTFCFSIQKPALTISTVRRLAFPVKRGQRALEEK